MGHYVLARKWRPKSFEDLVGQEHIVRALSNALNKGRIHHAYLFSGTRGIGKTTLARILAKCLNCESGVSASPCGHCSACQEIDSGRFVDFIEVDAASYTGIDNIREIIENSQYAPTVGRYKVYLIDEVHMLSKSAFNAMLKTLEEPPRHAVFVLATTDPQKVPVTVLSRCLQFNLKTISQAKIVDRLKDVLTAEGASFEFSALPIIARAASGSMRDALTLLDQAIAYGNGHLTESEARDLLGFVDQSYLFHLLDALCERNGQKLIKNIEKIASLGISFDSVLQEFITLLQQIAVVQSLPEASEKTDRQIFEFANRIDPDTIQIYYQVAVSGRRDMELTPDEYTGFTMTMLCMLSLAPSTNENVRLHSEAAQFASNSERAPSSQVLLPSNEDDDGADLEEMSQSIMDGVDDWFETIHYDTSESTVQNDIGIPDVPVSSKNDEQGQNVTYFDDKWYKIVCDFDDVVGHLASVCKLVEYDQNRLHLKVNHSYRGLLTNFGEELILAIQTKLGKKINVTFEIDDHKFVIDSHGHRFIHQGRILGDPFIQAALQEMDAQIFHIKPVLMPDMVHC